MSLPLALANAAHMTDRNDVKAVKTSTAVLLTPSTPTPNHCGSDLTATKEDTFGIVERMKTARLVERGVWVAWSRVGERLA